MEWVAWRERKSRSGPQGVRDKEGIGSVRQLSARPGSVPCEGSQEKEQTDG